ncbi:hypothetical protein [Mesobacillus foraminis]|uniref:hypothetical protein n=1 Tax=Mesobacillus foraminis TaxID=279826 RepID=UPI0013CF2315|nr:hypothetical protein [Mesobacillus foraminis]
MTRELYRSGEKMVIIIGIAVFVTILSLEVQLRRLNKTNQEIVDLLTELKNKND